MRTTWSLAKCRLQNICSAVYRYSASVPTVESQMSFGNIKSALYLYPTPAPSDSNTDYRHFAKLWVVRKSVKSPDKRSMKRIKWRMVTFAFIIGACSSRDSGNGIHESLIGFKSSTIMTMDDLVEAGDDTYKKLSSSKFNPETDTIRFSKNEIYISYLAIVNGCAKYQGDIDVRDDSIILKLKNINEVSCTEERCDRLIFKIKNAGNKKYIIGKGKIS